MMLSGRPFVVGKGLANSDCLMENNVRFGLMATLVLHALPIGIWWGQPAYSKWPAHATTETGILQVALRYGGDKADSFPHSPESQGKPLLPSEEAFLPADPAPTVPARSMNSGSLFFPKDAPYIPAGELDARPSPEAPVVVPFPDTPFDVPKAAAVLELYIGADGRVDRIEIDDSDLPPDFEKAAIETFMQARMRPGILHGQATRARMKILVEFEQR